MTAYEHAPLQEWVRFIDGDLEPEQREAMRQHAASCTLCHERLKSVRSTVSSFREPDEALEAIDVASEVMREVRQGPASNRMPVGVAWLAAAAALVAVVGAGLWWRSLSTPSADGFRSRSSGHALSADAWVGLDVYVQRETHVVERAGRRLPRDASLLFAYRNAGQKPFRHLMVFSVDGDGELRWFYPAYTDAQQNPSAILVKPSPSSTQLQNVSRHTFQPGPLYIYGLFTHKPLGVKAVEAELQALKNTASWAPPQRLPMPASGQRIISFEVEP